MSSNICPGCHHPTQPGAIYCDNCGFDLRNDPPAPVFAAGGGVPCPQCGSQNAAGTAFCENCGYRLAPASTAPNQEQPAAASPLPAQAEICRNCGYQNLPGAAFCENCGNALRERAGTPVNAQLPSPPPGGFVSGRFIIQVTNVSLPIPPGKTEIAIGREDSVSGIFPDINLDPNGGHDAGVGRQHARLTLLNGDVAITDLNSVNGTYLNRQRITPMQPYLLKDGDEIRMGRLAMNYYRR